MTAQAQYTQGPITAAQFNELWSAHLDALEGHLSPKRWILAAISVVLAAYPIARVLIPAVMHDLGPVAVRTALHLIGM
ncbi:MAG TPA: hypothetical protein VKV39_00125 [Candidatus Sulfotelmatobacter sp.]|nr:hypothetical protein [Candidatus Sulfotelmatobacter sp.]